MQDGREVKAQGLPGVEEDDEGGVCRGIEEERTRRCRGSCGGEYGIPILVRGVGKVVASAMAWVGVCLPVRIKLNLANMITHENEHLIIWYHHHEMNLSCIIYQSWLVDSWEPICNKKDRVSEAQEYQQ